MNQVAASDRPAPTSAIDMPDTTVNARAVFGIDAAPLEVLVRRWIDALPQYGPGHGALTGTIRSALPARLAVAGNYLDGVGVPACLAAAGRAAVSVVADAG